MERTKHVYVLEGELKTFPAETRNRPYMAEDEYKKHIEDYKMKIKKKDRNKKLKDLLDK